MPTLLLIELRSNKTVEMMIASVAVVAMAVMMEEEMMEEEMRDALVGGGIVMMEAISEKIVSVEVTVLGIVKETMEVETANAEIENK
jgi:hypothetical protein